MLRIITFAFVLCFAGPAFAVDFATPLVDLEGTTIRKDDKNILTLGDVATGALLGAYADEPNLGGDEKIKRWALAMKIHNNRKDPAISAEELTLMKKLIAKAFTPIVVGQAWTLLDPAGMPK